MIVCVAVVGQQNNPLYLQSFMEGDDALKFHYIVHCSLDVIEEKVSSSKRAGVNLNETFLGLLYPTEDYKVFGYVSNTKIKFILVTTDQDLRDADVRNFFRRIHAAYVDAASNPFHVPGKRITSPAFADRESLLGFEHRKCEYLSDVVFESDVNQCTGKAVQRELSSALSMHKKVVEGGIQFSGKASPFMDQIVRVIA